MPHTDTFLAHSHEPWLAALSVVVAILAAYTAFDLAGRVAASTSLERVFWLWGGAVAMGVGIWSMHFVAMLAFQLPIPVRYDIALTTLSLLVAVLASALALGIVSRPRVRWWHLGLGGLMMGAAIAGMHYLGMAAMRLKADLTYDPILFTASWMIAVAASLAALWLLARFRAAATPAERLLKFISAVLMGLAIAGMHFTGMAASRFTPRDTFPGSPAGSIEISLQGGGAIAGGAVALLVIVLVVSAFNSRLSRLNYSQKFGLVIALFIIPTVVIVFLYGREQYDRIEKYGYRELDGTRYLRPAQALLTEVTQHERTVGAYLEDRAPYGQVLETQAAVEAHLVELARLDEQYGAVLDTAERRTAIEADWRDLQSQALHLSRQEREARHAALLSTVRALISRVGDTSYLILDPDLDTYYLMDAVLLKLPAAQQQLAETLTLAERVLATEASAAEPRAQLLLEARAFSAHLTALEQSLQVSFANDPLGVQEDRLTPALAEYRQTTAALASLLEFSIASPPTLEREREQLAELGAAQREAQERLYAALSTGLEEGIQGRITRQRVQSGGLALFAGLTILAALVFGVSVIRGIVRPLLVLADATRRLAAGDLGARVNVAGSDEGSQLSLAFNDMARKLQISQTEIQARSRALVASAEVSRRLATILDEAQLVAEVVAQVKSAFDYYHTHIYLYDAARERLVMAGGTGAAGAQMLRDGHALTPGRGLVGRAAATGQTVLAPDTARDPNWLPNRLLPETRAEVAVPIIYGGTVVGVLDVQHNVVNGLGVADADLLTALASQVAIALQNARSYGQTQRIADREALVNYIGRKIQSAASPEAVLGIAARELGQALGARSASAHITARPGPANGANPAANGGARRP